MLLCLKLPVRLQPYAHLWCNSKCDQASADLLLYIKPYWITLARKEIGVLGFFACQICWC